MQLASFYFNTFFIFIISSVISNVKAGDVPSLDTETTFSSPSLNDIYKLFWERALGIHPPANDVTDNEALVNRREKIKENYTNIATNEKTSEIISNFLPNTGETIEAFASCYNDIENIFDSALRHKKLQNKFKIKNAMRALQLINGDSTIEHHRASCASAYGAYGYDDLPNIQQLCVLVWRLADIDVQNFVRSMIAEQCCTPEKWTQWRKPFIQNPKFAEILSYDEFGLALAADSEADNLFINSLVSTLQGEYELPAIGTQRIISNLQKEYIIRRIETLMPLIEALFMVMRGHNKHLLLECEANNPACPEGAYLNILKAIHEMTTDYEISYPSIQLQACN